MIFSAVFFGSRLEQLAMLAARHRVPASTAAIVDDTSARLKAARR
jgi:hypothetical protein